MKNLKKTGKNSLACEITNISAFGVWILVLNKEYFLDHKRFPWFKNSLVADVLKVKVVRDKYLRWESLDVDLDLDSLDNPDRYPLVARKSNIKKKIKTLPSSKLAA